MKSFYKKSEKRVPKPVKNRLWDSTFGPEAGQGECYVCGVTINSKSFEAGHVKAAAKGGKSIVENLRCICSDCNKSMGTHDLEMFKAIYFPDRIEEVKYNCRDPPKYAKVGPFRKEIKEKINYCDCKQKKNEPMYDEEIEEQFIKKLRFFDQFVYKPS